MTSLFAAGEFKNMIYDGIAISLVLLLLSGAVLLCILITATPFFMNHNNVSELMPLARKGARIGAVLAGICLALELISPGSVIRDLGLVIATVVIFVWSIGLIFLLKHYGRRLNFNG